MRHAIRKFESGILLTGFLAGFNLVASSCKTVNPEESSTKFYGADNQSGEMRFEAYVDMTLPKGVTTQEALFSGAAKVEVLDVVARQIQHLYASFSVHDAFVDNPGILEAKGTPELINAKIDTASRTARVTYSYSDRVVFKKKVFKKSDLSITFVMPRDPKTIYKKSLNPDGRNPCTDKEYNGEEDFW